MKENVNAIVEVEQENSSLYMSTVKEISRLDEEGLKFIKTFAKNYKVQRG